MLWWLLACGGEETKVDGGEPFIPLANCVGTMDFDAGPDGILEGSYTFLFNGRGDPDEVTYDQEVDGTINSRMAYLYDSNDLLLERTWDGDADGIVDIRTTYYYDGHDFLVEERQDTGDDGTDERSTTYTYDANGQTQLVTVWDGDVFREDGLYSWSDGLKESILWRNPERGDTLVSYAYNASRLLEREETDMAVDGVIEQRELTTWDDLGRELQVDKDIGADGVPEYRSQWSYVCEG